MDESAVLLGLIVKQSPLYSLPGPDGTGLVSLNPVRLDLHRPYVLYYTTEYVSWQVCKPGFFRAIAFAMELAPKWETPPGDPRDWARTHVLLSPGGAWVRQERLKRA